MLMRMWGEKNICTVCGNVNCVAAMEINMEVFQRKLKINYHMIQGYHPQRDI
jgi:hypothetical protein